jgi:CheY-like chemotaxis protein
MNPSRETKFRLDDLSLQASALRAQILERCRRTLNHDMNNAVQSIHSGLELLSKCIGNPGITRVTPQECIRLLQQQFTTLQNTFRRLLSEIADPPGDPETFDFSTLIAEVLQILRHEHAISRATIQVDPALEVRARKVHIRTILFGVLLEAIDHCRPDATIRITAGRHSFRTSLEISFSASVEDVRPIPSQHTAMTDLLVKLLNAEGGHLQIETRGTERVMLLTVPSAEVSADSCAEAVDGPLRVLIADRNRDAADSLAMILQLEGHEAKTIYNGAQLLGTLESFSPHVVLFDSDLPGCDPAEVASAARARVGKRALLAEVSSSDRSHSKEFDAHLIRPVEWPQLQALLQSTRSPS